MQLQGNTVLITGGGSGIGLALAREFHRAGSRLVLCGRRAAPLETAAREFEGARIRTCDLSRPEARRELAAWLADNVPELNVVINNAGIQRRVSLAAPDDWPALHQEVAINLEAPIDVAMLLAPQLAGRAGATLINVSSGLAFVPLTRVPVYCATKAAIHSFTLSLRHQLRATGIGVVEIMPPAVNTDLGGPGLHTFGMDVNELVQGIMPRLAAGETEIAVGFAQQASGATPQWREIFDRMNSGA